jgi:uncharacterized protein YmfQ (DUF2313 family)
MAGRFQVSDYLGAIQALLPRGRAWPRDADAVQTKVLGGLAATPARLDEAAIQLLVDIFPATTVALLPEWEATLGLPDPCAGPEPTIALRQAQVLARFLGFGGQSVPFFIAFAAALGFAITIQEYAGSTALANTWQVTVPGSGASYFTADGSYSEDPVDAVTSDAAVLQCEFERLKPAHTQLNWNFT